MSHSVTAGLKTYREYERMHDSDILQFEHTETMDDIFYLLNKTFDVMNARCTKDGITKEKWPAAKTV